MIAQLCARRCGALVLPDEGWRGRSAGGLVEGHHGLALIGDADRGDLAGIESAGHLAQGLGDEAPDLFGVVLDESRRWIGLAKLAVGDVDHAGLGIEDESSDPRGTGIDGDHQSHGSGR